MCFCLIALVCSRRNGSCFRLIYVCLCAFIDVLYTHLFHSYDNRELFSINDSGKYRFQLLMCARTNFIYTHVRLSMSCVLVSYINWKYSLIQTERFSVYSDFGITFERRRKCGRSEDSYSYLWTFYCNRLTSILIHTT